MNTPLVTITVTMTLTEAAYLSSVLSVGNDEETHSETAYELVEKIGEELDTLRRSGDREGLDTASTIVSDNAFARGTALDHQSFEAGDASMLSGCMDTQTH